MNKNKVFELLEKHGITKVEVEYSGGGDEGGVDAIVLFKGTEATLELDDLGLRQNTETALENALTGYVDDIGNGNYVTGILTWDVVTRRITDNYSVEELVAYPEEDVTKKVI